MKSLIQQLVEQPGPSGYEAGIRRLVRELIEPWMDPGRGDTLEVDPLGNLIACLGKPESAQGRKIMLAAHMDEIGLMVTHIDENGYARFIPLGGVRPGVCFSSRVRFLNGAAGVIGVERLEDPNRVPAFEQLYIDLGVNRLSECPVRVGDVAVFERPFLDLGSRMVSKAMDDRIGVAILIETIRQIRQGGMSSPHQLCFVFSVQEEVGVRGAKTAAFGVEPDLGLAVDVTGSGDTPKGMKMQVGLGKGPAIKVRDSRTLADPRVVDWMVRTAQAAGLPYQLEILEFGGTDAEAIQLSRAGALAGCLSIPCRYVHTTSEMVDFNDVQQAVQLLVALLTQPVHLE